MNGINKDLNYTFARVSSGLGLDFDAQVTASLMIQSNAFISIKTAAKLCSISRQEIDRRIHNGTFPKPLKLSGDEKSIRKAFRIQDVLAWLKCPADFQQHLNQ